MPADDRRDMEILNEETRKMLAGAEEEALLMAPFDLPLSAEITARCTPQGLVRSGGSCVSGGLLEAEGGYGLYLAVASLGEGALVVPMNAREMADVMTALAHTMRALVEAVGVGEEEEEED